MPGRKLKFGKPEVAACIDQLHAREPEGWRKTRLLAVKLAARGESTAAEVADLCGIARGHVFGWLGIVRERGLQAWLARGKPGPAAGTCRGVKAKVIEPLKGKLAAHEFANAQQARRWLQKAHGIERPSASVWNWLKKFGGVLRVPRPRHSGKKPGAEEEFQEQLGAKLASLGIEAGSRVKVWVMDEARLGLHTELRRVWTLRGRRPIVTRQIKYRWDSLYGALSLGAGEAHFAHLPGVSLDGDAGDLRDLAASDPVAIHVLLRDQAGFPLRDGDPRLPARVRLVDLPPYSPELNPCQQLWDILKDDLANRVHTSISKLRAAMKPTLRRSWGDPGAVLSLSGRPWMHPPRNTSH